MDNNPELDLLTNLYLHPVTDQEKALRFQSGLSCMDQLDFERWVVGKRRCKYFMDKLDKLTKNIN
jgi:hypothetical protein